MRLVTAALLAFAICSIANAQSTATISGRITDPSGAAMPNVMISATNPATGITRDTTTNSDGIYSIPSLQPGMYNMKAQVSGFAPQERKDLTLITGANLAVDFTMSVAAVTENVNVSATAALVETTESGSTGQLRTEEVQNLPMINRNYQGLMQIMPGARPSVSVNSTRAAFGNGIGVAGGTGRNVLVLMDGEDNRDEMVGGPSQNYTIEGIQEFRAMTYQFGAQYGGTNGAVIQVTTKSGANEIHGGGFLFGRNDALTATDYFTQASHSAKPAYDRWQYGGSFGGAIVKNKLFYFGAIERIQQDSSVTVSAPIFAQAQALAAALPQLHNNPVSSIPQSIRDLEYTLKGDYQLNASNALMVRFAQQRLDAPNDQFGPPGGSSTHADYTPTTSNNSDVNRLYSIAASHTWIVNSTTVNTFGFQRSHYTDAILCNCTGVTGLNQVNENLAFPSGLATGRLNNTTDQSFFQDKYNVKDDIAKQLGAHSLKFGGYYAWYPQIGFLLNAGCSCTGTTTFFDDPTTILTNTTKYPQGFFTPGAVRALNIGTPVVGGPNGNSFVDGQKWVGLYIQDDFKVLPRFTLNLGVRYDVQPRALNPAWSSNRAMLAMKAIGSPYGGVPHTQKLDFSPRIGFAWDVTGRQRDVLRVGAALMYDPWLHVVGFRAGLQSNPTLMLNSNYSDPAFGCAFSTTLCPLANYVYGDNATLAALAPPPTPTSLPAGKKTQGEFISPNFQDARNYVMHAGFTHQIGTNDAISADYTHIIGVHGMRLRDINPVEGAWDPKDCTVAVTPVPNTEYLYTACPAANQIIPYGTRRFAPQFASKLGDANIMSDVVVQESTNRSRYDELIIHWEHRAKRASFQASYTLAQSNAFGGIGTSGYGGGGIAASVNQDLAFGPGEWGPTAIDERHRVVVSGVFNLYWGIQVSPILQASSARAYNLVAGTDANGDGANATYVRDQYIDPATGVPVGINSMRGDPTFNLDFRGSKTINLHSEKYKLSLFAELYNVTNRANFGAAFGGNALSKATFEQPTGYAFGIPTSRQMQWGIRFAF